MVGNPLFEAMDGAVRGLSRGDVAEVEASGPEWNPDLMFEVTREGGGGRWGGNSDGDVVYVKCRGRWGGSTSDDELFMSIHFSNINLNAQVPRSHEEVQRLEGRYKATGGLHEGRVVELANGAQAVVLEGERGGWWSWRTGRRQWCWKVRGGGWWMSGQEWWASGRGGQQC